MWVRLKEERGLDRAALVRGNGQTLTRPQSSWKAEAQDRGRKKELGMEGGKHWAQPMDEKEGNLLGKGQIGCEK